MAAWQYNQSGYTYNQTGVKYNDSGVSPDVTVAAGVLSLLFSQQAPTVGTGTGVTVAVNALSLLFALKAPTIVVSRAVTVIPSLGQLFLSNPLPVVVAIRNIELSVVPRMADTKTRMKAVIDLLKTKGTVRQAAIPRFRSYKDL